MSHLLQAVHIMELALQRYGSYEMFEQVTGGNLLTKSRIWHSVKKYMEKEGCLGEVRGEATQSLFDDARFLFAHTWFHIVKYFSPRFVFKHNVKHNTALAVLTLV